MAWNTAVLLLALAVVELTLGEWFQDDPLRFLRVPRDVTWRYQIDYPGIAAADREVSYQRDRFGLRGDYGQPADIDILTVGGSTTDQRYVSDGATWQAVLMQRFRESGREIRVANAGIDGRTTFGHLHDFKLWFPRIDGLNPRYVLLYTGINDMFVDRPAPHKDDPIRRNESITERVMENSVLIRLYQTLIGMHLARRRDIAHSAIDYDQAAWTRKPLLTHHRQRLESRVDGYRRRLEALIRQIHAMDATPIVVTQPRGDFRLVNGEVTGLVNTQPRVRQSIRDNAMGLMRPGTANGVDYYRMLAPFNRASMAVCRRAHGICIDLVGELRFENGDFYDHTHTTRQGSRRIGEYLYKKLKNKLLAGPAAQAKRVR